ncbi:MAG: TonB-dependent receptor plug domain-containing protein [Caulobacteraceae bacterium]
MTIRGLRPRLLAGAALTMTCAMGQAATAQAQTSPPATAPTQTVDTVVVTASRINAAGFTAPTPTEVISQQAVQATAPVQITDSLKTLIPSFRTTGASTTPNVYANLRAVGANRTLVLVDGRRIVPTQPDGTVDLNVIPAGLVDRVDVVTGGASASWGSDAVTGVVNIVLKNKLEGVQGNIQGGQSTYGDKKTFTLSLAGGHSFAGGKGHVLVGGDYATDSGIGDMQWQFPRPWANQMRSFVGNAAFATNGLPAVIYSGNVRRADTSTGGLITLGPLRGTNFGPGGTTSQFGYGQQFGSGMIGGTSNYGEIPTPGGQLDFPFQKYSLMTHVDYDLTSNFSVFGEFLYSRSMSSGEGVPNRFDAATSGAVSCGSGGGKSSIVGALTSIAINNDNAYIPAAVKTAMANAGVSCFYMGRTFRDQQYVTSKDGTPHLYRGVAGFKGDLGHGWTVDGYYQYGQDRYQQRRSSDLIIPNLNLAVDAVTVTAGNVGASGLAVGSIACRSTLTNPTNGCVPINLFGEGSVTPQAWKYVTGTAALNQDFKQQVGAFNLHGSPISLWAGPVNLATGFEYRKEEINATVDPLSAVSAFQSGNRSGAKGAYDVKEVYGEVALPLAKDMPFIRAMNLDAAVRYTDYSSSGAVTTWKVGGTWDVTDEVRIRVTRSRDIRAGNLSELYTPTQIATANFLNPNGSNLPGQQITTGNPKLAPEVADDFTGGFVLSPNMVPGLRLSADYYDMSITNAIGTLTAAQVINLCYGLGVAKLPQYCSYIGLNSSGIISSVTLVQLNLNKYNTSGVDMEASYRTPLSRFRSSWPGVLSLRFAANWTDKLATTASVGATVTDAAGLYTTPHWSFVDSATYEVGPATIEVDNQFYGGGAIDKTKVLGQVSAIGININSVPSVVYTNGSISWKLPERYGARTEAYFRVTNIFNAWPPFPSNGGGIFDEVGRAFRLGVRFKY